MKKTQFKNKKTQLKDRWKYEKNIYTNKKIIHYNLYYDLFYWANFKPLYKNFKKTPLKLYFNHWGRKY